MKGFQTLDHLGYPNWIPNADVNDDDKVDIKDVAVVAKNYGEMDP